MKVAVFSIILIAAAHPDFAEHPATVQDMYEEEQPRGSPSQAKKVVLDGISHFSEQAVSSKAKKNTKVWSEQSLRKAINALGILQIPGLKLVKVSKSMVDIMKRTPDNVIIRSNSYDQRGSVDVQYDSSSKCKEVLHTMHKLFHHDLRLAYQVQTLTCQGTCGVEVCSLRQKTMLVYIMNKYHQLVPNTITVGCACVCT